MAIDSFLFAAYSNYQRNFDSRDIHTWQIWRQTIEFLSFRKHRVSAGPLDTFDNVTQPAIKNKITNFHREKLSSCNTSDVSSAIYGGEKVGRVSQRRRRYLHVALHVSIRLLCETIDVEIEAVAKKIRWLTFRMMIHHRASSFDHVTYIDCTFLKQGLILF